MSGINSVNRHTGSIEVYSAQTVTVQTPAPPTAGAASTEGQSGSLGKDGMSTDGRGESSQIEIAHIKETAPAEATPPKPKEDGGKGGVFGAIGGFVSDIGSAVGDGLGAVGDGLMAVGEMMADTANSTVDVVADVARVSLKAAINPVGNLMEAVGLDDPLQFLDDIVDDGVNTVADVAKFANEVTLNPLGTAKDMVTDLVGGDDEE